MESEEKVGEPFNNLVRASLTDLYKLTGAYALWKCGRSGERAVFELFFRKSPFEGEFAILAGVEEAVRFIRNFGFSEEEIEYLRRLLPEAEEEFFYWVREIDTKDLTISAMSEGSVVFPREALLKVEGPLALVQLVETTLLNLINFPSLIATNAARFRLAAGPKKTLIEFGLRRAQGPDGAVSASRYSILGGFDSTSNFLASMISRLDCQGSHDHSYVMSFTGPEDLKEKGILNARGEWDEEFVDRVLEYRDQLSPDTNSGELAAFIAYAQARPNKFLSLVDTYNTLESGVPNFLAVALALKDCGYTPRGVRIDSGDLAYLSKRIRSMFSEVGRRFKNDFDRLTIMASNDINEAVLRSLNEQGHEIDAFGIGTHLVTCQAQPAFGGVYKLVSITGIPRIKISEDIEKVTIPGDTEVYRLYGRDGIALADLIALASEEAPKVGEAVICCHPANYGKRVKVIPSRVEPLLVQVWGDCSQKPLSLEEAIKNREKQLAATRTDHLRDKNPTPYKVSVTEKLFRATQELLQSEASVEVLQ